MYSTYKESGIEWLGRIPEAWQIIKLRYLADITTGDKDTENKEEDGLYPFFVRSQTVERISSYSFDGEAILTAGDGVGVCKVWHYVNERFDFHQRVYMLSNFKDVFGKYLFLFIKENFIHEVLKLSAKSTVDSLRRPMFQNFPVAVPPLPEQKQIARFLDHQTGIIDALIEKKEALIQKLKEQRQAIINEAVTKGLNPNDPLRDSGIPWLGEIPEHWEVSKIKYEFHNLNFKRVPLSSSERGDMKNKTYDYYGASGIIDKVEEYIFEGKNILIGEDGANLLTRSKRLAFIADGKYWVNNHAHILHPKEGDILFYSELLEQIDYTPLIVGAAQPKLTQESLVNIEIPKPPVSEQREIGKFLHLKSMKFKSSIDTVETQIQKLREYRQSLISEAVTGKIDVREWEPKN